MKRILFLVLLGTMTLCAQEYTRGVGVYPGDPGEDFSPSMRVDSGTYRNLALRRLAYQSSSFDYNLTAQLVTDGIRETRTPRWLVTSTSEKGVLAKSEREVLFDGNWVTEIELNGRAPWIQIEQGGTDSLPEVDRVDVDAAIGPYVDDLHEWSCALSGSDDGQTWREYGSVQGITRPTGELKASIKLTGPVRSRFYRVAFVSGRPLEWQVGEVAFSRAGRRVEFAGPHHFASAWKSAGTDEEWVYVDLGAACTFDRVALVLDPAGVAGVRAGFRRRCADGVPFRVCPSRAAPLTISSSRSPRKAVTSAC